MSCEHYKSALIEAAANGVAPQGELRAHFAACASCREAFSQEQSLFAAIDSGLQAAANAEVPPSLLPRVRAGIETIPVAPSRWTPGWFALAGASLVAVTVLLAFVIRQNRIANPPIHSADNRPAVPKSVPPAQRPLPATSSPRDEALPRPSMRAASASLPSEYAAATQSFPEVLVPRDQEVLLAGYAQEWRSRKRAPLIADDAKQKVVALLEVAPIQITDLDVKPLAEGDSQ